MALAGCGKDDPPPTPAAVPGSVTYPIRIERWLPYLTEPVVESVEAPIDEDTIVLADRYGAWTLTWDTSPEIAVYGQSPYWMRVRPLMAGGVVTITYAPPIVAASQ